MKLGARTCGETEPQQRELVAQMDADKRMEEALCATEPRYQVLTEAIPQLVWTALPDGSCDYASRQWENYSGLPAKQSLDELWVQLLHPDDRERVPLAWSQAVESGVAADFDCRLRGQDGRYGWFKVRAVPLRDEAGQVVKWFGTCTDVNALVEAREALIQRQQELEGLVQERTADVARLKDKLQEENFRLREKVRVDFGHHRMVGQSQAIRRVLAQVEQVVAGLRQTTGQLQGLVTRFNA